MIFFKTIFGKKEAEIDLEPLKAALKPIIAPLYQSAVVLEKINTKEADKVSKSSFGGKPKVFSEGFVWPRHKGIPLSFLAQIDLAEISNMIPNDWLPKTGHLLFFYDTTSMPWGFDPKDRGGWQVIYQDKAGKEIDYPKDLAPECHVQPFPISMREKLMLPSMNSDEIKQLSLSDDQYEAYDELHEVVLEEEPFLSHQFAGYPLAIQDDEMALECQLAANGIYVGSPEDYDRPEAQALFEGAQDWKLLFQLDSDDDLGVMWGDTGRIYFWVREEEARAKNFEKCWVILQCG